MLRIKRSVAAAFSQQHFNTSVIDAAVVAAAPAAAAPAPADAGAKRKREGEDSMAALEAEVAPPPALQPGTRVKGFVSAGIIQQGNDDKDKAAAGGGDGGPAAPSNPEELELGGGGEEEEEGGDGVELQQQAVPEAVFGSLAKKPRTEG